MREKTVEPKYKYNTDLEQWAEWASCLSRLKMSSDYAKEYLNKFKRNMTAQERIELGKISSSYDLIYFKQWEKLIRKIRGL
jgi:hypothetical protein